MEPTAVFLVIALIVRLLLDLASGIRPSYEFDACYGVLFLVLGLAEFAMDGQALVGFVSIALGIGYSLVGFCRYKKQVGLRGKPQ
jgi:hypothetical protein